LLSRYDYYTNYEETTRGSSKSLPAPLGTIPIHVRGGVVIPTQEPASNTVQSRKNPFGLIIALDDSGRASGSLYWDGGDTIQPLETGEYALLQFSVESVSHFVVCCYVQPFLGGDNHTYCYVFTLISNRQIFTYCYMDLTDKFFGIVYRGVISRYLFF